MREPLGTTRKGQVLLGGVGFIAGVGSGLGLETMPATFEPILQFALYALGWLLHAHLHYEPSERTFFAVLLPTLGTLWALLFAYAFAHLRREESIDQSRRATIISENDKSL